MANPAVRIPIIGKCAAAFEGVAEYRPPLYLFPDVGVAEDPLSATLVASRSRWSLTQISLTDDFFAPPPSVEETGGETAEASLEALVGSNKLPFLANVSGTPYSSVTLMEQLLTFAKNCRVEEDAARKVLLTPEFVHYLGYQRLIELNDNFSRRDGAGPSKRQRNNDVEDEQERSDHRDLPPSSSPWAADTGSVAAAEASVEKKCEVLSALSRAIGRSWKSLQSTAIQTNIVTPGVNTTSPYVNPATLEGTIDVPVPQQHERAAVATCTVRSNAGDAGASVTIPLMLGETRFGRSSTTRSGAPSVALGPYAANPETISEHHFSIVATPSLLQLIVYGRNGVLIPDLHRWVLGETVALASDVELLLDGGNVKVKVSMDDAELPQKRRKSEEALTK